MVVSCILKWLVFTFESMVDVVRGSHVTTGDRFCGADDNVGGFGNVLVTGRQTQANIFFCYRFYFSCQIDIKMSTIQKCSCKIQY